MQDFPPDDLWVELTDEHGQPMTVLPFQEAIALERQRIAAQEKALDIQRDSAPIPFIPLPGRPESYDFQRLAKAIRRVAAFKSFVPETREQAMWMRNVQLYWEAKGIVVANEIYNVIPDPTQPHEPVWRMLPPQSLKNLKIEVPAEVSWYQLLQAGEAEIRAWATAEGIHYPFNTVEDLFIDTLQSDFDASLAEEAFSPVPTASKRKEVRDHYRSWLKFLGDHFNGEPEEEEYKAVLRTMGWKGHALLALRDKKRDKLLRERWQTYLSKQRPLIKLLDTQLEWKDGIPYQSTKTKGKRTKNRKPIQGFVTEDNHFDWRWR